MLSKHKSSFIVDAIPTTTDECLIDDQRKKALKSATQEQLNQ
jgi:hypothetical protein